MMLSKYLPASCAYVEKGNYIAIRGLLHPCGRYKVGVEYRVEYLLVLYLQVMYVGRACLPTGPAPEMNDASCVTDCDCPSINLGRCRVEYSTLPILLE